jgi:hypothetical protein
VQLSRKIIILNVIGCVGLGMDIPVGGFGVGGVCEAGPEIERSLLQDAVMDDKREGEVNVDMKADCSDVNVEVDTKHDENELTELRDNENVSCGDIVSTNGKDDKAKNEEGENDTGKGDNYVICEANNKELDTGVN